MSVRMGLLALLAERPSHGYQLKAGFEERTGGVWSLNVGQVYTTLDRLKADGLVEPMEIEAADGDGRDRRPWRITREGKEALGTWFDEPAVEPVPAREDFLVKVLMAFHSSPTEALAVIDRQRTELYRLLQDARRTTRRTRAGGDTADLAAELMAEVVASRWEADLRWLDICESQLKSQTKKRNPA
ncbi:MAG: PadR family transcriptional regulator [Aquihabitans sp.]